MSEPFLSYKLHQEKLYADVRKSLWYVLLKDKWSHMTARGFFSCVGTKPDVLDYFYNKFLIHHNVTMMEFLRFNMFMMFYIPEDAFHSVVSDCCKEKFRNSHRRIRDILSRVRIIDPEFILENVDPPMTGGEEDWKKPFTFGSWGGQVDTTEKFIKTSVDFETAHEDYSGYKGGTTKKFQVITSFRLGQLLGWDGPFNGPTNDSKCLRISESVEFFKFHELYLIGDSKYSAHSHVYTVKDFRFKWQKKKLCGRRSVVEHIMSRYSRYNILRADFRHDVKLLTTYFRIISNIVYVEGLLYPLRREDARSMKEKGEFKPELFFQ